MSAYPGETVVQEQYTVDAICRECGVVGSSLVRNEDGLFEICAKCGDDFGPVQS